MISGLAPEVVDELRALYPRNQIPALVDRLAAFPHQVIASAAYLAKQIGRSRRSVFRYFAKLKLDGLLLRVWGPRDNPPPWASKPWALKQHGYKLTVVTGQLDRLVAKGIALRVERTRAKGQRAHDRKSAKAREKRREHQKYHEEWAAQFPVLEELRRRTGGASTLFSHAGTRAQANVPDTSATPERSDQPPD